MRKRYSSPEDFLQTFHNCKKGRTLVIGSACYGNELDRRELYGNAVGIDMQAGEGVDIIHDCEKPLPDEIGLFDHIDCASVLEHVQRPWIMAENLMRVMKPKASIYIQVPFVWRVHNYPGDYWRMTGQALEIIFPDVSWKERGYFSQNGFKHGNENAEMHGMTYFIRSELVAYGLLDI